MIQKKVVNKSYKFESDFFDNLQKENNKSFPHINPQLNKLEVKKYKIRSSLFLKKNSSQNYKINSEKVSNLEISTNASDLKINEYSFISKIDNGTKSGK